MSENQSITERLERAKSIILESLDDLNTELDTQGSLSDNRIIKTYVDVIEEGNSDNGADIIDDIFGLCSSILEKTENGIICLALTDIILQRNEEKLFLNDEQRGQLEKMRGNYDYVVDMAMVKTYQESNNQEKIKELVDKHIDSVDDENKEVLTELIRDRKRIQHGQKRFALILAIGALTIVMLLYISRIIFTSPAPEPVVQNTTSQIQMIKPVAGIDNPLFTTGELLYCKKIYAVLYSVGQKIDQSQTALVARYQDNVTDYTSRCVKYQYTPDDMAKVDAEMKVFNPDNDAVVVIQQWEAQIKTRATNPQNSSEIPELPAK